jgi:microcin C transport system permease protein
MALNPLTLRKLQRFREIRRGYYSFVILIVLLAISAVSELLINDTPVAVRYQGEWSFPTYSGVKLGADYGLEGSAGAPAR